MTVPTKYGVVDGEQPVAYAHRESSAGGLTSCGKAISHVSLERPADLPMCPNCTRFDISTGRREAP
jgi:hypothetical protein